MTETQPKDASRSRQLRRTNALLIVLVLMGAGVIMVTLRSVILPVFFAFFLSYLGMPVMRMGKRLRVPVPLLVLLVIALFAVAIGGVGLVFYTSGTEFAEQLPDFQDRLWQISQQALKIPSIKRWLLKTDQPAQSAVQEPGAEIVSDPVPDPPDPTPEFRDPLAILEDGGVFELAGDVLGGLANVALILVFLVFILLDRGREVMDRRIVQAFSRPGTDSARPVLEQIHKDIEQYLVTKTLISLLTGALVTGTLAIIGLPFAILFGLMAFTMNYIPNVGSIIASIPPILVAIVQYYGTEGAVGQVLLVAGILLAIQFAVGNILDPLITGKRLHLNPITVMIWLVVWGWLWGVWGMILAVPLASVTRIITERTESFRSVGALMSDE